MPRGGRRAGAGRKPADDTAIADFIDALRPVRAGRNGYTHLDRYRDFNRVLLSTPEGKRVLSQIIDLCEGAAIQEADLNNHALLAARAWGKRIGLQISQFASVPPPEGLPGE